MQYFFNLFYDLSVKVYQWMATTTPGFDKVMEKVQAESSKRDTKRREMREAQQKAKKEMKMFGRVQSHSDQMVTKKSGE